MGQPLRSNHGKVEPQSWNLPPEQMALALSQEDAWGLATPGKPSAVLVPLLPSAQGWQLLFIRRSMHVETHRGQLGCPGGRREAHDATPLATALRETHEELGIPPGQVQVLGGLPTHLTVTTGFLIHPYVGVVPAQVPLFPQAGEVDGVLTIPLAFFIDSAHHEIRTWEREGVLHPVHYYHYGEETLWGATAAIVHLFVQRLQSLA